MKKDFPGHGLLDLDGLKELSVPQLVELYNVKHPEKPVKLFNKKPVAIERVWESYPEAAPAAEGEATATPTNEETEMAKAAKKASKPKTPGKGRTPKFDVEAKIKLLVSENPKRKGSASFKRFEKYENGMKVSEALAKGVRSADIGWDQKKNYIALR